MTPTRHDLDDSMPRALVVDDNRSLAEDLAEILEQEGYRVHVFDDPAEAVRRASELEFDFALLDVRMPGMDGVALHAQLLRGHPRASYILMTAYSEDERIAEALAAGVRHVLTKPVPLEELLRTMAELRGHPA